MRYLKHPKERALATRIQRGARRPSILRWIDGRRSRRSFELRVALATTMTLVLAGVFAAVGGAGYAAKAVKQARATVADAVAPKKASNFAAPSQAVLRSASDDQYRPVRVTICHRSASGVARTLVLPAAAAKAHLRQHRGGHGRPGPDTSGRCPARPPRRPARGHHDRHKPTARPGHQRHQRAAPQHGRKRQSHSRHPRSGQR